MLLSKPDTSPSAPIRMSVISSMLISLSVHSRLVSPSTPPTFDPIQSAAPFRPPLLRYQLDSRVTVGRIGVPDIAGHIFDVSDAVVDALLCITADVAIPSTE